MEIIAAGFMRQTRFDPRRKAATEQQLYDALPDTLRALRQAGETQPGNQRLSARITLEELMAAGQRLFDRLRQTMGTAAAETACWSTRSPVCCRDWPPSTRA